MTLRDHPAMRYRGLSNWPPVWISPDKRLRAEVGVLRGTTYYDSEPIRLFLTMKYADKRWVGCLSFSDESFARMLDRILQEHLGEAIMEIGNLRIDRL